MFAESKIDFLLEINTEKYENGLNALCSRSQACVEVKPLFISILIRSKIVIIIVTKKSDSIFGFNAKNLF